MVAYIQIFSSLNKNIIQFLKLQPTIAVERVLLSLMVKNNTIPKNQIVHSIL